MASFPGSVKTFTNRNAGDTIQPSHVNDLQDEVNAIEDGILNGTARIRSSNAQIDGLSTFASRPVMPAPEMALVYRVSTQSINAGSSGASLGSVTFNGESFVTNAAMHSTASNSERLIPQSTGVYRFAAQATLAGSPSGNEAVRLLLVDSSAAAVGFNDQPVVNFAASVQVSGIKRFDALGGYVILQYQNVSGVSTLSLSSGIGNTWFSMVKL